MDEEGVQSGNKYRRWDWVNSRVRHNEKYLLALRACRFEIYLPTFKSSLPPLFVHCIYFHFLLAHWACKFEFHMPTPKIYMPQTVESPFLLTLH